MRLGNEKQVLITAVALYRLLASRLIVVLYVRLYKARFLKFARLWKEDKYLMGICHSYYPQKRALSLRTVVVSGSATNCDARTTRTPETHSL